MEERKVEKIVNISTFLQISKNLFSSLLKPWLNLFFNPKRRDRSLSRSPRTIYIVIILNNLRKQLLNALLRTYQILLFIYLFIIYYCHV